MTNTKNITITAISALIILSMASMAFAYGPGQGRGMGRGDGYHHNRAYSQLTPEKQEAVDAIYEKYSPKFDELRTQMWTNHSVLQAMINGGNADEKKIAKLTSEMTDLRDQMRDTRDAMRAELEKETGIVAFGGRGNGRGYNGGDCGFGQGYGQGRGQGNCPRFN